MGPYDDANVKPACAMCNMMKGARRVRSFVEAARTIATHRAGLDFGRFPRRFRDNVSKRSRSSYISQSSTHTKTHSLSNAQFAAIVARPCHYCGKAPRAPRDGDRGHFNGLDRLDSDNRVYAEGTVVACCGDCNMLKYKYAEDAFIAQCVAVATFNVGVDAFPGDVDEEEEDNDDEAAALEGEGAAEVRLENAAEEAAAAAASEGGDDAAASDPRSNSPRRWRGKTKAPALILVTAPHPVRGAIVGGCSSARSSSSGERAPRSASSTRSACDGGARPPTGGARSRLTGNAYPPRLCGDDARERAVDGVAAARRGATAEQLGVERGAHGRAVEAFHRATERRRELQQVRDAERVAARVGARRVEQRRVEEDGVALPHRQLHAARREVLDEGFARRREIAWRVFVRVRQVERRSRLERHVAVRDRALEREIERRAATRRGGARSGPGRGDSRAEPARRRSGGD